MTTKCITVDSLSVPERLGYNDRGAVFVDDVLVWHNRMSCCPNGFQHATGKGWLEVFGWVAPFVGEWECIISPKHGKCIMIDGGGDVPTRNPNANHGGKYVARAVEIHCGDTEQNRGSEACLTVPPSIWPDFIKHFELGDKGQICIIDKQQAAA